MPVFAVYGIENKGENKKSANVEKRRRILFVVEMRGIEPLTSALRTQRSPS